MREIKYKAWSFEEEKMYECVSIATTRDKNRWITQVITENRYINMIEGEYELLQYTGLKDVKENEIYEGDILKDFITDKKYRVFWDSYGMFIFTEFGSTSGGYDYYGFKEEVNIDCTLVIGNIYENKELLEEK